MSTFTRIERCFLPAPEIGRWNGGNFQIESCPTTQKIIHYVKNVFLLLLLLLAAPFTLAYDWITQKKIAPMSKAPDIKPATPHWPPAQRGSAISLFQTSGLGTDYCAVAALLGIGECDWNSWMKERRHIVHAPGFDFREFFIDILSDPTPYIEMIRSQNENARRFSLEWSVIEPRPGVIDERAVAVYRNFIDRLIEAGITPSVTLSHFVMPNWFYQKGNFQETANIDDYVRFGVKAMELFPQVKDWWSFNELGVKAFQQTREVYPTDLPEGSPLAKRVHAAGIATLNTLIAHCKLHKEVERRFPDRKLGVTHQWLKFDTEQGNWLEKRVASIFTQFGFDPVYRFFKEGRYSFEFPFMANIQFEMPREEFDANGHFLKRLGVQAYPKPMVKMGLNRGQTYPGLPSSIKNLPFFSFGSSCEPGGTVMRFGPRHKAEGMDEILDEAFALTDEVYITEFGSDARVQKWGRPGFELDRQAQADYLQQLIDRIRAYCTRTGREIKGIFCWSDLSPQLEWENGLECHLPLLEATVDPNRRMTGFTETPASRVLKEAYAVPVVAVEHSA